MRTRFEEIIGFARAVFARYGAHRGSLAAGGLAFFVALSVAPAALAIGWLVGRFISPQEVRDTLTSIASSTPGLVAQAQPVIDSLVSIVASASSGGVTVTTFIGVLIAVYAASKTVFGLRAALDAAFGAPERYRGIVGRFAAAVATLIGLVLAVAAILVLTFVPRMLTALGFTDLRLSSGSWLVDWVVLALVVWLACWGLIARMPDTGRRVPPWSAGVVVASAWIVAVSAGVGIYARISTSLNAAVVIFGSALVVLLWLYLCFTGLLLGAEVEAERRERSGRRTAGE